MSTIQVRPIDPTSSSDLDGCAAAIDTAFVEGDSWFKKDDCKHRCGNGGQDIQDILAEATSSFLLAEDTATDTIVGALRVDWNNDTKVGHFGMLGVPSASAGKGIGKSLVAAMAAFLKDEKGQNEISMPVVSTNNERLVAWYEKQGFQCIGEKFPFPVPEIMLDEYRDTIDMIQMRRVL